MSAEDLVVSLLVYFFISESEELRNTIAAVSVVLAALILLGVTVGTCIIVNKQKSLAKRKLDGRRYNYY
jgi:VIT1/CCC1 family predicted Fe2+/Mn2+ transporter